MLSTALQARPGCLSCEQPTRRTRSRLSAECVTNASAGAPRVNSAEDATPTLQGARAPSRRLVLSAAALAALVYQPVRVGSATAAEAAVTTYTDQLDRFTLDVPSGWQRGEGAASGAVGTRRVVAFHPPDELQTNVSVVSTNASVEITKMSSMGTAFEFAFHMVNSQNRPKRDGSGQAAELLSAEERDGAYVVEYTISRPSKGINRHLYSLAMLRFDGKYNRFFTVTGQWAEADAERVGSVVRAAVDSFKLAPL